MDWYFVSGFADRAYRYVLKGAFVAEHKVIAVMIAYNPEQCIVDNVKSYIEHVERVIIFKNSKISDDVIGAFENLLVSEKIIFIGDEVNIGIAAALNAGVALAKEYEADWVLTMDQDSSLEFLCPLRSFLENNAPASLYYPSCILNAEQRTPAIPPWIMTSGNLLSVEAWAAVGGFDDGLFIDGVDFDFCMKLIRKNFELVHSDAIQLHHQLGENNQLKSFFGRNFWITNHKPFRYYYIHRNYLIILFRYLFYKPAWSIYLFKILVSSLFKASFFEEDRIAKIDMILRGTIAAVFGKKGAITK